MTISSIAANRAFLSKAAATAAVVNAAVAATSLGFDLELPELFYSLWTAEALRGGPHQIGALAGILARSIWDVFMVVMMFLLLKLIVRKTWIAVILQSLMILAIFAGESLALPFGILLIALVWICLFRFGLLTFLAFFTVNGMLLEMPLTHDLSAWYAGSTWITLLVIAALTGWGFYVALAGRQVFSDALATGPEAVKH